MWTTTNPSHTALHFVTYLYLDHFASNISNNNLYKMQEGWTSFAQYALQKKKLSVVFQPLSSSAVNALGVTRITPPEKLYIALESVTFKMFKTDFMGAENFLASIRVPNMPIAIHVQNRENSSTMARSSKKRFLNTVTELAIEVVKKGDVLGVTEAAKLSHL